MKSITAPRHAVRVAICALAAAGLCAAGQHAYAQGFVIVDSQGFEQPKFNPAFSNSETNYTGQLEGQAPFPEPLPVGTWLQTTPIGNYNSKATVVSSAPGNATQAVKVDRGANTDARWAVPVSGWPSERYVCIDWDMAVDQTTLPAGSFGPYFAVEAYDDDAATIGLLASLGVDAATGEVLYQQTGTGVLVAPGPTVTFGSWNHFTIVLDYTDKDFEVYLNNSLLATETFVDQNNVPGGLAQFTDADIAALAAGGDAASQSATGTAYYDNFRVLESAVNPCVVPEPAAAALVCLGLGLVARRRR